MDEITAKILKKSGKRFRITVILMVAVALFGLRDVVLLKFALKMFIRSDLAVQDMLLTGEFDRDNFTKATKLALYPPPSNKSDDEIWLYQIETNFGHSVSAFRIQEGLPAWVNRPQSEEIANWVKDQTKKLRIPEHRNELRSKPTQTWRFDWRIGTVQFWRKYYKSADGIDYTLLIAERSSDSLRWGVVLSNEAAWTSFFKSLITPSQGSFPEPDNPKFAIGRVFALSNPEGRGIGMRAYLGDSLIFRSAALDTTADSLSLGYPPNPIIEYYANPSGTLPQLKKILPWSQLFTILLPLIFIIPLYTSYRTIRRLAESNKNIQ